MNEHDFGTQLREIRLARGETLERVSSATGLSIAMLSRVERGERLPSPDSVELLATHFGLGVDYLLGETIANRMLNRYGRESTDRAAERIMSAPREDAEHVESTPPRTYGIFQSVSAEKAFAPQSVTQAPARRRRASSGSGLSSSLLDSAESRPDLDAETLAVLDSAIAAAASATRLVARTLSEISAVRRRGVVERLGALGEPSAGLLRVLAQDDDEAVRAAAQEALRKLGLA